MRALRIAIQKSGRLFEPSVELLRSAGLEFEFYKNSLISTCRNFPMEIYFLRDDDIPEYVQDGISDLGMCGANVIAEKQVDVTSLQNLGYGKCRLTLAVPNDGPIQTPVQLAGKTVATTYPKLTQRFLDDRGIAASVVAISGSAEISPALGLSDAICDLVSTGSTLKSNGLRPIGDVMSSEALLIGHNGIAHYPIVEDFLLRIRSVLRAQGHKYVVLNIERSRLDTIVQLLPGIKSPTVVPLAEDDWVAVHTVISESDFWERIAQVKQAGAQGIVVMNMEKIIL
jgi:ATP phosphoribosyltransferase